MHLSPLKRNCVVLEGTTLFTTARIGRQLLRATGNKIVLPTRCFTSATANDKKQSSFFPSKDCDNMVWSYLYVCSACNTPTCWNQLFLELLVCFIIRVIHLMLSFFQFKKLWSYCLHFNSGYAIICAVIYPRTALVKLLSWKDYDDYCICTPAFVNSVYSILLVCILTLAMQKFVQ